MPYPNFAIVIHYKAPADAGNILKNLFLLQITRQTHLFLTDPLSLGTRDPSLPHTQDEPLHHSLHTKNKSKKLPSWWQRPLCVL